MMNIKSEKINEIESVFLKGKLEQNFSSVLIILFVTAIFALGCYYIFYHVPMDFWITKRRLFTRPSNTGLAVDAMGEVFTIFLIVICCLIILVPTFILFKIISILKDLKLKEKRIAVLEVEELTPYTEKEIRSLNLQDTHVLKFKENSLKLKNHRFHERRNKILLAAKKIQVHQAKFSKVILNLTVIE